MKLQARKRFGQHFLVDANVIHRIIALLNPHSCEHLVEIGPGIGALTLPLLGQIKQLDAIELDRDVIPVLQAKVAHLQAKLNLISQDALTVDFSALKQDERLLRVFGNLPYNISTPLIFHLLTYSPLIQDMVFMLQKEVADRLAALPNSKDYGRLSVMVQYHAAVTLHFVVPQTAFKPPPAVLSRMVTLTPHRVYPHKAHDVVLFSALVKCAFNHRRKTLRNSLKDFINREIPWETLGISSGSRPEELTVAQFVQLANSLCEG